jgi:hypothetical protein
MILGTRIAAGAKTTGTISASSTVELVPGGAESGEACNILIEVQSFV